MIRIIRKPVFANVKTKPQISFGVTYRIGENRELRRQSTNSARIYHPSLWVSQFIWYFIVSCRILIKFVCHGSRPNTQPVVRKSINQTEKQFNTSRIARKPVLGFFYRVRHTSGCVAKNEGYRLEIWDSWRYNHLGPLTREKRVKMREKKFVHRLSCTFIFSVMRLPSNAFSIVMLSFPLPFSNGCCAFHLSERIY